MTATFVRGRLRKVILTFGLFSICWLSCAESAAFQSVELGNDRADTLMSDLLGKTMKLADGSIEKSNLIDNAIRSAQEQNLLLPFFRVLVDELGVSAKTTSEFEKSKQVLIVARRVAERTPIPTGLDHGRMWLYEGTIRMREQNYLEAIRALRQAEIHVRDNAKESAKIQNFLGICLMQFGAPNEDTAKALEKCLKLADDESYFQTTAAINLGSLYARMGEFEKAKKILEGKLISPKFDSYRSQLLEAKILLHDGETEKAIAICDAILETVDGVSSETLSFTNQILSRCHEIRGDSKQAIKLLEKGLEQASDKERVMLRLGKVFLTTGDSENAIKHFSNALETADLVVRDRAVRQLVQVYESLDQPRQALRFSKMAIENQKEREQQMVELARTEYQPILNLSKFKLLAEEAKRSRIKTEALEQKSAAYRGARNWTILGAFVALLGTFLFFRGEMRRREAELVVVESAKRSHLRTELEQKKRVEAIGQLTGNVAHDFNNVLQVVAHTNFLIKESLQEQLTREQEALFDSSIESVKIGAKISEQLLTFAKKQVTNPQVALVSKLFESSKLLFASVGGETMRIDVKHIHPNLAINVDRAQFSNAILNLLINAKDASNGKGLVDILVSRVEMGTVQAAQWSLSAGNYVRVDVVDAGRGMTSEQIQKACEPFFTTKSPATGTGLGLSSVKGFVEQAEGSMHISSSVDEGTTVSLVFPEHYVELAPYTAVKKPDPPLSQPPFCKCLIVEDNDAVRESLELMVEQVGYECESHVNADSAKAFLSEHDDIHIVISDIRMPGEMDGVDLAEWISRTRPNISVILVSGNAAPVQLSGCQFLRKPFRFKELIGALEIAARSNGEKENGLAPQLDAWKKR